MNELENFRKKVTELNDMLDDYDAIEQEWLEGENRKRQALDHRNSLKPAWISKAIILFLVWALLGYFAKKLFGIVDSKIIFDKTSKIFVIVLAAVEITYMVTFPMFSRRYRKADKYLEKLKAELEESLSGRINFICNCMNDNFPEIPEDYRSASVIRIFAGYIDNRRVHDFESMFNLYETELHQARLEENQQQIRSELYEQSNMISWLASQIR